MKTVPLDTDKIIENLKRLGAVGLTCQQAMLNFGKAAKLLNMSGQSPNDWRKFTMRK